ncbi:MAG: hypothetical protein IMZ67_05935 [Acidobacteria bacterium]|nr:hypothetical protein [Acidobacteriota bacterium]
MTHPLSKEDWTEVRAALARALENELTAPLTRFVGVLEALTTRVEQLERAARVGASAEPRGVGAAAAVGDVHAEGDGGPS